MNFLPRHAAFEVERSPVALACASSLSDMYSSIAVPAGLAVNPTRALTVAASVRRVAVIDPHHAGHHFPWMVDFCLSFLEVGMEVTAIFPQPDRLREEVLRRMPAAAPDLAVVSSEGLIETCETLSIPRRLFVAARNWSRVQTCLDNLPRGLRPDAVFFAYIDGMLGRGIPPFLVDRLFKYRWSGLYMSPTWMRASRRLWPELQSSVAWCLRAENCEAIAVLDEGLVDRLGNLFPDKPVVHLPDFLPGSSQAIQPTICEEIRARAQGRCVVGVVGSLQSRKGISCLLKIALEASDSPFYFVFAGEFVPNGFSDEERALWKAVIAHPPENCYIRATAIESEAEYVAIANSCDVFYAAYLRFPNSSNALVWAAWLRKPILVSEGYLMEERVRRYNLGIAVPEGDRHACRFALDEMRRQIEDGNTHEFGFARYLHDHSRERLALGLRRLTHSHVL